jgi:hypothetical protein
MRASFAVSAAALTLIAGGPAAAATVLSAGWQSSCGKSTCFDSHGAFSQTFSAKDFSGPIDVSKLFLQRSVLGSMDNQFFRLSFQVNGHEVGSWGDWNMSSVGGDELSFSGSDLMWNPADGDLVLVLQVVGPNGELLGQAGAGGGGGGGGGGGRAAPAGDPPGYQGPGPGDFMPPPPQEDQFSSSQFDLVQGDGPILNNASVGGVPEPATWSLMIGGFALAGAALRRRRAPLKA